MAYTKSLVTFIDVLGFRALLKSDPAGTKVLKVFKDLRRYGTEDLLGVGKSRKARYLHFSDSVVRVIPLPDGESSNRARAVILHELESLTYIQGELAATGVLLRGGIASGPAYADETSAFGPAFVDAYTIETQFALYPRIALHPELVLEFGTQTENGLQIFAKDDLPLTRAGSDGLHFVDYLRNFPREVHSDPSPDREEIAERYITLRKALIESELSSRSFTDPIRTKYVWLGRYHNEVVTELLGARSTSLRVICYA